MKVTGTKRPFRFARDSLALALGGVFAGWLFVAPALSADDALSAGFQKPPAQAYPSGSAGLSANADTFRAALERLKNYNIYYVSTGSARAPVRGGRTFNGRLAAPPNNSGPYQNIPYFTETPWTWAIDKEFYRDAMVIAYRAPDKATNRPVNRMIRDAQPGAKKISRTNGAYTPDAPLRPSGIIGPVLLVGERP